MEVFISWINGYLWGPPMIILLFGCHLFLTWKTKFIQRKIPMAIKLMLSKDDQEAGSISPFGALATALASTIGTGNIIGVGTAVACGGPGSILWMWLIGFFGIATKYGESLLALRYRVKKADGTYAGGAMYILQNGLNYKKMGILFAWLTVFCSFGIGCAVQSNAIASLFTLNFNIEPWISGLIIAFLTFIVIVGGVKSISKTCEYLVPFMSLFYVLGCFYILVQYRAFFIPAVEVIISAAFNTKAATGGALGFTILQACRYGMARGLFSNEAGMGSSPIVSAAAQSRNSVRQALIASTGPFFDTVIVCLMTGLVLVCSMLANNIGFQSTTDGNALCLMAFSSIPYVGKVILIIGIFTFAYSTILGWCYYGESALSYLFGNKPIKYYRIAWCVVAFLGAVNGVQLVFDISDTLNALMAIPNIIALLLLSRVIVLETDLFINDIEAKDQREVPVVTKAIYEK